MKRIRRKPLNLDYTTLTPMEVYNYVVSGKLLKFPNGYVNKENMKEIIREVILNKEKMTRHDICKKLSYSYLKKINLGGTRKAFDGNIYSLITYCFPEMEIRYWELNKVETGFWEKEENRKEFMAWIAQKENVNVKSVESLKRINVNIIQKYGGSRALKSGGGTYELILLIAETEVKEWQILKMRSWTEEKVREAVKWLIEEKLKWSHEEVVNNISANIFYENDLGGLLCKYCDHSPLRALQVAYPSEYTKVRNSRPEYLRKK